MDFVNLRKTGDSWEFATEADLEDFVWANLKELFGLIPLKRFQQITIVDIALDTWLKRL
ncbi:hypothetical protein NIES4072_32570 [Nostoc commune NIES-4072]|uniref:Uncharacterized protein n=1 Tax=Nostoc commune NIES-4072 TaxID=2005467 RepID=A0A2R5FNH2_NOSCO|nr:hypothetical protein NIES4070_58190 [Nostoc commune HK-02]GBG19589.1 hypothetical protein NIES4072_32570 [Nostoc commune NIES-4072]